MKKGILTALVLSLTLVFTFASTVLAGPISLTNPGFETGNTTGWTETVPPGGSIAVVGSHTSDWGTLYSPQGGLCFARLKTDGPGSESKLSQSFAGLAGDTISGWAFFDAWDYVPYNDYAYVRVTDPAGVVTQVFYSDINATGNYGETPWTVWSYTLALSGSYTVVAGVANALDSILDSYMGFDMESDFEIDIDIKPRSDPNAINRNKKGVTAVAILGSEYFDPTSLDPEMMSFTFCGVAVEPAHDITDPEVFGDHIVEPYVWEDPDGVPGSGDEIWGTANDDMIPDLVVHFDTQDFAGEIDGEKGDDFTAELEVTYDGITLTGCDVFLIQK
jgi:hypothetical protein